MSYWNRYPLERGKYCPRCRRHVLAREKQFNVWAHMGGVFLTCGLWLPFMIIAAFLHGLSGKYLCTRCGGKCR